MLRPSSGQFHRLMYPARIVGNRKRPLNLMSGIKVDRAAVSNGSCLCFSDFLVTRMQVTKKMQPSEKSALNESKLSVDSLGSKRSPATTTDGTSTFELRFTCSDKKQRSCQHYSVQ